METVFNPFEQLDIFLLIFIRLISFISVVPLFGIRSIPTYAKLGFAFFIALIVFNIDNPLFYIEYNGSVINYAFLVIQEIIIGILIGFGIYITFSIIVLAGQFIDHHIGFTMVNVFDPLSQYQLSITANFYYYLLLLVMIATNMHFFMIKGIVEAFRLIPLGNIQVNVLLYNSMIKFFTDYFIIAFKISSPILAGILVVDVILGVLARAVPQLNMFVIGMPLKVIIGLIILLMTILMFPSIADFIFNKMIQVIDQLIKGMKT